MSKLHHRVVTDVKDLVEMTASARMVPLVLQPGMIHAELAALDEQGVIIEVLDYSFRVATRGRSLDGRVGYVIQLRGAPIRMNGLTLRPGVLQGYGEGAEVCAVTTGPARVGIVSVPVDALTAQAGALPIAVDLPRGACRTVPAVDAPCLREMFDTMLTMARTESANGLQSRSWKRFPDTALRVMALSFATGRPRMQPESGLLNSQRITRRCEEYAEATHYHDVTLGRLSEVSGVSDRRVRSAFSDCFGMSPTAYFRIAALHHVRRALLDGERTRDAVSRAASDFGFWHLSRFAAQYRSLFDESPSATLGRAVARGPLIRSDTG